MNKDKKPSYGELEQRVRDLETRLFEARHAEKLATGKAAEFQDLFSKAPLVMFIVDRDRRIVHLNDAATAMTRRMQEESIGKRGGEALRCVSSYNDVRGCGFSAACESCVIRNTVLDTFRTGKEHRSVEAPIPYDSGKGTVDLWVLVSTSLMAHRGVNTVMVCLEDITMRKRTEQALEQSELKFRLVTETIEEVFWMSTLGIGKMIYISQGYETLWQNSREYLYRSPKSFLEAIHPDDINDYLAVIEKYHGKGRPYECEYRIIRKDGQERWIHERGYPVPQEWEGERLMAGVCTDITERKCAENALRISWHEHETREKIGKLFLTSPKERLFFDVLDMLLDQLSSDYGYIGYLDEDGEFLCHTMKTGGRQKRHIPGGRKLIQRQSWVGKWGRSLLERKSIVCNDGLTPPEGGQRLNNALLVPLLVGQEIVGQVAVANKAASYEVEDQRRLESLSEFISPILRIFLDKENAENSLRSYVKKVEEKNIALRVLLENREEEKKLLADSILRSFQRLVFPYFRKLRNNQNKEDMITILNIIEQHTMESLSSLDKTISASYSILTPLEIQVADLVKAGKSSKQVSAMLNISLRSVFFHRNNIRKKLNIKNKKANLRSFLLTMN